MKFYLCSDHFPPEAFLNPEVEDKRFLRLNRTESIPIPTIFEDNFMQNAKEVAKNCENFLHHAKIADVTTERHRRTKRLKETSKFVKTEEEENKYVEEEFIDEDLRIEPDQEAAETVDINTFCRLCTKEFEEMIPIFDEMGELHADTMCFKLMPPGLIARDDGLPQYACTDCIDKLQACASIIGGFVENQDLFVSE